MLIVRSRGMGHVDWRAKGSWVGQVGSRAERVGEAAEEGGAARRAGSVKPVPQSERGRGGEALAAVFLRYLVIPKL